MLLSIALIYRVIFPLSRGLTKIGRFQSCVRRISRNHSLEAVVLADSLSIRPRIMFNFSINPLVFV